MAPHTEAEMKPSDLKFEMEEEWQNGCRGLNERYTELWRRGLWTDCSFVVGGGGSGSGGASGSGSGNGSGARCVAHRVVLSAASPVFAAMFYGSMAAPDHHHDPVHIDDMDFEAFQLMLEYIYTDNITVKTCEEACNLYYGAHKYMLTHLQAVCKAYLLSNVAPACVFNVYEMAKLFAEQEIVKKCLEVMSSETSAVLESGKPEEAKLETLIELLSLDSLAVDSELDLFRALEWYAVAHPQNDPDEDLKVDVEEVSSENKKPKLSIRDALNKIRFLTIPPEEFASYDTSSLLSESEMLAISLNLMSQRAHKPMPEGFSTSRDTRTKGDRDSATLKMRIEKKLLSGFISETINVQNFKFSLVLENDDNDQGHSNIFVGLHKMNKGQQCKALLELKLRSQCSSISPFCYSKTHTFTRSDWYIQLNNNAIPKTDIANLSDGEDIEAELRVILKK